MAGPNGQPQRPRFSVSTPSDDELDNSQSRSVSRDRGKAFETAYKKANGLDSPSLGGHTVLNMPIVEDPSATTSDAEGAAAPAATERTPFAIGELNSSRIFLSPSKRKHSTSTPYGTFEGEASGGRQHYHPKFLTLNGPAPMPGAGLTRSTSIFKLSGMIDDRDGTFEKYRMPDERLKEFKKPVRRFYEAQNEILDGFAEVDEILANTKAMASTGELAPMIPTKPTASAERDEAHQVSVKLAINVNFALNFLLLGAKIAIVIISSSMSLIASTVDSAMDFLSTMIIFGTSKIIDYRDWRTSYQYPTGRRRMEPMSVVIFSVFMIASFLQVFIESAQRLMDKNLQTAVIPTIGKIVMVSTIVIKAAVWVWCRTIKNSSVEALTQDAENDIVFNFFSLLFPFVGEQLGWRYLDPLGGLLLSVYIMVEWTHTLLDNVKKLSGKRASPAAHQRVAYLITRFSPLIKGIQHLSVYHSGDGLIVETDIVLPPRCDLTTGHNLGESSQYSLERLHGVDRAYVHLDVTANPLSGHLDR